MATAYSELDVQNGSDAMSTFAQLSEIKSKVKITKLRKALLQYCKLDTLAMVKILEKLREESHKSRLY